MEVWLYLSQSKIHTEALSILITTLGFTVTKEQSPDSKVALADFTYVFPPFPPPSSVPTLALTSGNVEECVDLLRRGYRGYLSPDTDGSTLQRALQAISQGEVWAKHEVVAKALSSPQRPGASNGVTKREAQILELLATGLSNRNIAAQLTVSEATIKIYMSRLLMKYHAHNRTELVLAYQRSLRGS